MTKPTDERGEGADFCSVDGREECRPVTAFSTFPVQDTLSSSSQETEKACARYPSLASLGTSPQQQVNRLLFIHNRFRKLQR